MKKAVILILGVVLVVVVAGILMVKMKAKNQDALDALYDFSPVQRMDLSNKVEDTGTVVLAKNMDIYPDYEVTVGQIYVKNGDTIKKGQLLMTLQSPAMKSSWADANSALQQAKINLDLAQKELFRTKALFAVQGATVDDVETAQNKVDVDQEQAKDAQAKLEQVIYFPDGANIMASDHYTLLIKAPFDGLVAWIYSKPGDKVEPQAVQNTATSVTESPMISLSQKNSLQVEIEVDQSEINMIHLGQKAIVTASDEDQTKFNGVVTGLGLVGTNTAGVITYPVRIVVDQDPKQILKNAMTVDGTILTSEYPNVLAAPPGAVVERRGHSMVGIRQDNRVIYIRVETGITSNGFTEITSGLKDGDLIAVPKPAIPKNSTNNNSPTRGMGLGGFGR